MNVAADEIETLVNKIWASIENWYRKKEPRLLEYVAQAASDEQIREFENRVGVSLPSDYRASLKRHNGGGFIGSFEYLSLAEALDRWKLMTELAQEGVCQNKTAADDGGRVIQNKWWHQGWVPVAEHKAGVWICIDLAPGVNGVPGQILEMDVHEGPSASEYKSFLEWLRSYRDDLIRGMYDVDEYGYLVER